MTKKLLFCTPAEMPCRFSGGRWRSCAASQRLQFGDGVNTDMVAELTSACPAGVSWCGGVRGMPGCLRCHSQLSLPPWARAAWSTRASPMPEAGMAALVGCAARRRKCLRACGAEAAPR